MVYLSAEHKVSANLDPKVPGAVLLLNGASIRRHVEDVWGSRPVRPESEHLKFGFIEVHVDTVCPSVHGLKVQLEGFAVLLLHDAPLEPCVI